MSKGKQKIEIKQIEMKSRRHVTLSKRRKGLFKKCAELCSSSGSQFAAITFSIAGKPFSSGCPSPDAVIQRFLNDSSTNSGIDISVLERPSSSVNWWENPTENMGLVELEEFKIALEGLRNKVLSRVEVITLESELFGDLSCQETVDIGFTDAESGVQVSELCQENPKEFNVECSDVDEGIEVAKKLCQEGFDFGCKEEKLDDKDADYFEWMNNTAPEIYPELFSVNGSYSLLNMISSC